jgi:hypothetical protein
MIDQQNEHAGDSAAVGGWIAYLRCVQALKKAREGNADANAR